MVVDATPGRAYRPRPPAVAAARRVFSPNPQIGTIESGKLADLVILDADPLADIGNARRINKVIKGGHVFEVGKLKSQ
jgi:imidazolonepropionase-like amidohydrolase